MLTNYLKTAIRNLLKHKGYSFINIAGLAVGIACFITLALFIVDELSYDKFYKNADNIYRVYVKQFIGGQDGCNSKTPGPLGPELAQRFPEVSAFTRIGYYGQYRFRYGDKVYREWKIYAVDSAFFDVFSVSFIDGNPKTALIKPNSLVLTETAARKYFADENPVGKTLTIDKSYRPDYLNREKQYRDASESFLITGLIKDFPQNSHFSSDFLVSMSTYQVNPFWIDLWYSTYIILKPGTDADAFEKKLAGVVLDKVGPVAEKVLGISIREFFEAGNIYGYHLQPMTSIYLRSFRDYGIDLNTEWGDIKSSDVTYIYIFSAVALFIILIAIINFVNLATARSEKRAREVGIRKTLGSDKRDLIVQFISEAVVMSALSVVVALALLEIILPVFNNLADRQLSFALFDNFYNIPLLAALILVVGILAGAYPAFFLASFQPVQVLKKSAKGNRKSYTRSVLVIFQFAISIALLIGTIIIRDQLDYIQNKNLGFNKEHLFAVLNANVLGPRSEIFKQELLKNPNIISATVSSQMFRAGVPGNGYLYNKKTGTDPIAFQYVDTDYNFLETYQVKLIKGRFFSKHFSSDSSAVIVNEAALKAFNDREPLDKELTSIGNEDKSKTYHIIGVIKDFNYESLHQQVRPLVLHLGQVRQAANTLTIRIAATDIRETLKFIEETWNRIGNDEGMYGRFVDENIARMYESEERTGKIATAFSSLAIFIACLGLLGLSAFVTEQRTKEIGIRKILGASVSEIILLLSKEFAAWVLLANCIAWPVAWYVSRNWLDNFAYRVDISWWVFALAGAMVLLIALITVNGQAIRAATANPVESLRYE